MTSDTATLGRSMQVSVGKDCANFVLSSTQHSCFTSRHCTGLDSLYVHMGNTAAQSIASMRAQHKDCCKVAGPDQICQSDV